jgi:pyruvate formate lyase activating enzyme
MTEVLADLEFYLKSGGGVTLSGGDPLTQWPFALAVPQECKRHGLHTCLETENHFHPEILDKVFPFVDLVITDIKHMHPQAHREFTGVDNTLILKNIAYIVRRGMPLVIRLPVIPGHNDSVENMTATAEFITGRLNNRVLQVQLLPYRQLGVEKYQSLDLPYRMADFPLPEWEIRERKILSLVELFRRYGIPAVVGSSAK